MKHSYNQKNSITLFGDSNARPVDRLSHTPTVFERLQLYRIFQTLGQLIDRLHEEETYPPFLEELLDTVDVLLRQVYEGQSYDDSEVKTNYPQFSQKVFK